MEEDEINRRLQCYQKCYSADECKESSVCIAEPSSRIIIDKVISDIDAFLKNADRALHVCDRENVCHCPDRHNGCTCDNDHYFSVISSKCDLSSNCQPTLEFHFDQAINLSRTKNLRFFYFRGPADEETAAFDIINRVRSGKGGKPVVEDTKVRFWCLGVVENFSKG